MSDATLEEMRLRLNDGDETVTSEIQQLVESRRQERGGHTEWGLLCEDAGLMALAFREFQLAMRDDRNDLVACFRLAEHYREHGDTARAQALLERLLANDPAREDWLVAYVELMREERGQPKIDEAVTRAVEHGLSADRAAELRGRPGPTEDTEDTKRPALAPTDSDCVRFAALFAGREDVHARQWTRNDRRETGYSPVQEPLTPAVVRNHLLGAYTVGVYPIRLDGMAGWFALDLDITKPALEQARRDADYARSLRSLMRQQGPLLLQRLRQLDFHPLFENSGYKGRHYWVFLDQPEDAKVLHQFGRLVTAWLQPQIAQELHIEFFPKQGRRSGKGLGNLIKLPLGIHRRTGYRSLFLDDESDPLPDPLAALKEIQTADRQTLYRAIDRLKAQMGQVPSGEPAASVEADVAQPQPVAAPLPPDVAPPWTEADFETDRRVGHLLNECPVLAKLKQQVDQHRRLNHDEQLVLIHTLGHVPGGPQAVNYLLTKCVDVASEQYMKSTLRGNPMSCPKIRKRIGHITRRVACQCVFEFASDRYPTPVLHLLTVPEETQEPASEPQMAETLDPETVARRFGVLDRRRQEIQHEWQQLHDALCRILDAQPDRTLTLDDGCYRLVQREGVDELVWEERPGPATQTNETVPGAREQSPEQNDAGSRSEKSL